MFKCLDGFSRLNRAHQVAHLFPILQFDTCALKHKVGLEDRKQRLKDPLCYQYKRKYADYKSNHQDKKRFDNTQSERGG